MTPIPHLLLPVTQLIAFTLPPFRHRAATFAPLIIFLAVWSYIDLTPHEPTNATLHLQTNRPPLDILLPLLSQWPWYLGTLEKLLFSIPEHAFWGLNRPRGEALTLSWPAKFKWAVALYCSPRGVGWNFCAPGVPAYTGPKSRLGFVQHQIKQVVVFAICIDAMGFYSREYYFGAREWGSEGVTSYSSNWMRSAVNAVHGLLTPYFGLNIAYCQIAIVCVGLGFDAPENWPPLYGRIQDATTIRRFWNTWWHQCVRNMYIGYSRQLTRAIGFARGSWQSSYTQLYFVFMLSATGHALVLYGLPHASSLTTWDRWWSFWLCFACQAPAIHAEDMVIWGWRQVSLEGKDEGKRGSERWQRNVGRLWVVIWSWFISVWMVDPGLKLGTYEMSPLPFPIVEPVLDYLGLKQVVSAVINWDL